MGFGCCQPLSLASQVALMVKNLPAKPGDIRDSGSILESGRSPGGEHGNPRLYSCHGQRSLGGYSPQRHKGQTRLKLLSMHSQPVSHNFPDLPPRLVSWMNWRCVPYEEMQRDAPHNLFGLQSSSELAPVSFRRQCTPLCQARVPRRPVSPWGVVAAVHISSSPEGT